MKRNEDFRKALGQPDEYFRRSVIDTLDQLNRQAEKESRPQRRYTTRIIASFAAVVLLVAGVILNRQYIPGISPDGHIDTINPTPTVATQLTKSSSVVETDLAMLSIRNAGIDENTVYVSVEVMPRKKKSLALNWSIKPYSDSVTTIGKTPDYEGQTVMGWAREHDYEELIRVVFSNAFEPLTPGVVDASLDHRTGPVPDPAFDSICINHSEYEDNGATVIYVSGNSLPDTKEYMLGFVLQVWDMTLKDHEMHDSAFSIDTQQIFGNIPFSIGEPEEPEVIAEYKPVLNPENTSTTLVLLRTSYSDFYEIRTNIASSVQEYTGTSIFEYDNGLPSPISVSITTGTEIKTEESNGIYIFRRACDINDVPEKLSLFLKSGQMQEFILTSSRAGTPTGNSTSRKVVPPLEEYSAQAWAITAEGYTDLLNNMDTRIGQVYVIKGFIQEVLSDNPLRVLMNTGEDGASQPVIVECPAYRNFTWEPGTFYRIYADASSIENEIPVLTAQYSYTESKGNTVETDLATLTFREAVRDGDDIRITVQLQPKNEKCIATSMVDNLTDSCGPVAEYYGIETERSNKTLYGWMVDHGYQENLAIMIDSLEAEENGNYRGTFRTKKCQIMDDGSSLLTIAGPAADDNIYNLMWLFVPRNMEEKGQPLLWDSRDSGTLRLEVTDTQELSATIIAPYMVPWAESDLSALVSTGSNDVPQMNNPAVADTDYATLKVREAKTDGYGVFLQVEVQSKEEKTLVVADSLDIMNTSVMKLGINERKSIYKWAVDNQYKILIVNFMSPADTIDDDSGLYRGFHSYWNTPSFIEENGSTVIKVVAYAIPDTAQYELIFALSTVDPDPSGDPIYRSLEAGSIPVTVSETEEPKVVAEYKAVDSSSFEFPVPNATLTLLRSSCSDYCELRSSDTEHISDSLVHYGWMLSNDFFADGDLVEWNDREEKNFVIYSQPIEEGNMVVLRRSWAFPEEIPDQLRLGETSGYYSGLYEKVQ